MYQSRYKSLSGSKKEDVAICKSLGLKKRMYPSVKVWVKGRGCIHL